MSRLHTPTANRVTDKEDNGHCAVWSDRINHGRETQIDEPRLAQNRYSGWMTLVGSTTTGGACAARLPSPPASLLARPRCPRYGQFRSQASAMKLDQTPFRSSSRLFFHLPSSSFQRSQKFAFVRSPPPPKVGQVAVYFLSTRK